MKILVLNTGSSSIKFQLFDMPAQKVLGAGLVEKIGEESGAVSYHRISGGLEIKLEINIADHEQGLSEIVRLLLDKEKGVVISTEEIKAVGHRVVHGGDKFTQPTVIKEDILDQLKSISYLAPLHNPAGIKGIEVAIDSFTSARQVAIFDTAFHQTMPDCAYRFAIPDSLYEEHGLRAYGFHGTSHQYVMRTAAHFKSRPLDQFNAITIHLGNGCSMAAIRAGKCVDTSMGLTPLGGLMMGTRSGDIDPSVLLFLSDHLGMSTKAIDKLLNKESGLKGLTGTNDLRAVLSKYEAGDEHAKLAIAMYVYRIRKYIGAYAAILGRLDAIIFTAGVGENSSLIREKVCEHLEILGIELDHDKNIQTTVGIKEIHSSASQVHLMVVPTNEELEIANQTYAILASS
jgi:acetate kinase